MKPANSTNGRNQCSEESVTEAVCPMTTEHETRRRVAEVGGRDSAKEIIDPSHTNVDRFSVSPADPMLMAHVMSRRPAT